MYDSVNEFLKVHYEKPDNINNLYSILFSNRIYVKNNNQCIIFFCLEEKHDYLFGYPFCIEHGHRILIKVYNTLNKTEKRIITKRYLDARIVIVNLKTLERLEQK